MTCAVRGSSVNVRENLAVTVVLAFSVTVQVPVPVQPPPLHPAKVTPAAATAVKVAEVPLLRVSVQSVPQLIPVPVIVPSPDPALATVSVKVWLKVAVTVVLAVKFTVQVPVPLQPPPLQPANTDPLAALAVKVTEVPLLKDAEHVPPQLIPAGEEVTVPLPWPLLTMVSVCVWGARFKLNDRFPPDVVPHADTSIKYVVLAVRLTWTREVRSLGKATSSLHPPTTSASVAAKWTESTVS